MTYNSGLGLASISFDCLIGILDHLIISGLKLFQLLLLGHVIVSQRVKSLFKITMLLIDQHNCSIAGLVLHGRSLSWSTFKGIIQYFLVALLINI